MGGSSRRKQDTTNTQTSTNVANNGEFAGAENVTVDSSRVEDSHNTDNSVRTEDSHNTDIRDSNNDNRRFESKVEDSNNDNRTYDNSVEDSHNTDVRDSNNDNRRYDGEYAGVQGNITVTDHGAINAANDLAKQALDENAKVTREAFDFGDKAITAVTDANKEIGNVADKAIEANKDVAKTALTDGFQFGEKIIGSLENVANNSINKVTEFGGDVIDDFKEASRDFSSSLESLASKNQQQNQTTIQHIADKASDDKAVIAALAKSTALAGQDLVAKSSERIILYVVGGLAAVAVVMLATRK